MGTVDIYRSRRTCYAQCLFWIRDERVSIGDLSQWVLKNRPEGTFYAKEVSPAYNQENPQANVVMFDKNIISLETTDDVHQISRGCVVMYNGHPWMVDSVQQRVRRRETQFSNEPSYTTIINMRK